MSDVAWPQEITPDQQATPEFKAIWSVIRTWDVAVPEQYGGYCGANGSHAGAIINALARVGALKRPMDREKVARMITDWACSPGVIEHAQRLALSDAIIAADAKGELS